MAKKPEQKTAKRNNRRRISQAIAHTEALHKARIDTIRDVAAVLDHEARNLLGALKTCVQVLRRNPHITPADTELLDIIQSGSHRLNEIVSEFSAFGRFELPHFQEVDLHGLIDETLTQLQRDERCSSSIVVSRRFDLSIRSLKADRDQLAQVLWNLFLNAVQAMGDQGQLTVETQRAVKEIKVSIRDTGPGIPTTVLPHIFAPLYSTKSRGIGLGLPIVGSIVEKHGGQITVHSELGIGTSFVVVLPIELYPGGRAK